MQGAHALRNAGRDTIQDKKQAEEEIAEWNSQLEPLLRDEWELNTAMARIGLRGKAGVKPRWKFDKKHGKLVRDGKGGIDWYRYKKEILHAKLFPFAQECEKERPGTIVQEDKAPSHNHHYQTHFYSMAKVQRMVWCGNSPDLNAIEPAWPWLKRQTTKKGAPQNRGEAIKRWGKTWNELPQEQIQRWIERIPYHISQIIELEGGNEYKEGRAPFFGPKRTRGGQRKSGRPTEEEEEGP
jgi:hypothetical protein